MKNKKFLAMLMALAMMFSLCVGVFATDPDPEPDPEPLSSEPVDGNTSFSGDAEVQVPTISVSVPQTTTVFINPMGFLVKLEGGMASAEDAEDTDSVTTSKIVSPIVPILNNTPMELSVGVIGSVTPAATNVALAISPTPIGADDTKNTVFVYTLFGKPHYDPPVDDDEDTEDVNEQADEKYSWESNFTTTYNATTPAANTLALTTKAPTTPVVVGKIEAASYTPASGDDPDADDYEAAKTEPGRFAFQFLGDCNKNAKAAWNDGDKVTVALAFTFKPAEANNNAGNGAGNGGGNAGGDGGNAGG